MQVLQFFLIKFVETSHGAPCAGALQDLPGLGLKSRARAANQSNGSRIPNPSQVCAPLPGMVTEIAVSPGTEVKAGDKLAIIEAMKMLTTISAPNDGTIKEILVKKGVQVDSDDLLVVMEA